jgi:hypothetical protein
MASQLLAFEKSVILMQMQVEESFVSVARSTGRPGVVVFDRGLLDIPACKYARTVSTTSCRKQKENKAKLICRHEHSIGTCHAYTVDLTPRQRTAILRCTILPGDRPDLPRDTWLSVLKDMGCTEQQFAKRYDLVRLG